MTIRLGTSLRCRTAEHTEAAGRPLMAQLGITQLEDITGLDRLGLPVFLSMRPGGRAARVHAGKGLTAQDARVGALMEAVECAVAEQAAATATYVQQPLRRLAARLPGTLTLLDFAPRVEARFDPERPVAAVRCTDLLNPQRPLLPAELLMLSAPRDQGPPLFGGGSNGLAIGNSLNEATLHALLEVLERDAIAMGMAQHQARFVQTSTLPEPVAGHARRWQRLGVQLHVRHLPSEFGLPCIEATLHEPGHPQLALARGWGLHFDRQVALARAVCEAAQSRAYRLHSRQPALAALYGSQRRGDTAAGAHAQTQFLALLAGAHQGIDFATLPHGRHADVETALNDVLARLRERGFGHVFRKRMPHAAAARRGLQVVKLVVPRCENLLGGARCAGPRLRAVAARQAA